MTQTPNSFAWRPTDLEAIRKALSIPVTPASIRAINDEMAQLERDYPDAIPGAKDSLDAIATIDQGLASGGAQTEPFVTKITRKGAVTPANPAQLPTRKLDVIEYATDLLMEEVSTEYAEPTHASSGLSPGAQRRTHVDNLLLLVLPRLRNWQAPQPSPFQGQLARS